MLLRPRRLRSLEGRRRHLALLQVTHKEHSVLRQAAAMEDIEVPSFFALEAAGKSIPHVKG